MIPTLHDPGWSEILADVWTHPKLQQLLLFLQQEIQQGKQLLPEKDQWLSAFNATPFTQTKVVILGQDPYPTPGQAHGLSFSVQVHNHQLPKSLQNIFLELASDLSIHNTSGYLMPWAQQGVLLLNTILTVEAHRSNAHQGKGWEILTDAAIMALSQREEHCVFVLWGKHAQQKTAYINANRHTLICSPHPSPLSAYRGFFGSRPFSRINAALQAHQQSTIDWQLPPLSFQLTH